MTSIIIIILNTAAVTKLHASGKWNPPPPQKLQVASTAYCYVRYKFWAVFTHFGCAVSAAMLDHNDRFSYQCRLFKCLRYTAFNNRGGWETQKVKGGRSWYNSTYHHGIRLKELRKTTKNFRQDSNRKRSEYKSTPMSVHQSVLVSKCLTRLCFSTLSPVNNKINRQN